MPNSNPTRGCVYCHSDLFKGEPTKHEAAIFDCLNCHTNHPRTKDRIPMHLKAEVSQLCYQCHASASYFLGCFKPNDTDCGHPASNHPVSGPVDPKQPGRPFNCISCHEPHSAKMDDLFRYPYPKDHRLGKSRACLECHFGPQ